LNNPNAIKAPKLFKRCSSYYSISTQSKRYRKI